MCHSAGFVSTLHMCHFAGFGSIIWAIVQDLATCCGPQRMIWLHPMDHSAGSASMLWGYSARPGSCFVPQLSTVPRHTAARDLVPCYGPQHRFWFHIIWHSVGLVRRYGPQGSSLFYAMAAACELVPRSMGHSTRSGSSLWPHAKGCLE
jgi:hypothetical protein